MELVLPEGSQVEDLEIISVWQSIWSDLYYSDLHVIRSLTDASQLIGDSKILKNLSICKVEVLVLITV